MGVCVARGESPAPPSTPAPYPGGRTPSTSKSYGDCDRSGGGNNGAIEPAPSPPARPAEQRRPTAEAEDLPFSGYNVSVAPRLSRSRSIDVLRRLSASRGALAAPDPEADLRAIPRGSLAGSSGGGGGTAGGVGEGPERRQSVSPHTRRLSSVLNDVGQQMGALCPREPGEATDAYLQRVFARLDSDGDGLVSLDDITSGVARGRRLSVVAALSAPPPNADNSSSGGGGGGGDNNGTSSPTRKGVTLAEFMRVFRHVHERGDCVFADENSASGSSAGADDDGGLSSSPSSSAAGGDGSIHSPTGSAAAAGTLASSRRPAAQHRRAPLYDARVRYLPAQAGRIRCAAVSGDGDLYAVAHQHDMMMHLYATGSGAATRSLSGHTAALYDVAFARGRKLVATAACDGLLVLWDRVIGMDTQAVQHPGVVLAVAFSACGRFVYTGCQDNTVRRIICATGDCVAECCMTANAAKRGVVTALATQAGRTAVVVAASSEGRLLVMNADDLRATNQLGGHTSFVLRIAFLEGDDAFATLCPRKLLLWRADPLACIAALDSYTTARPLRLPAHRPLWTCSSVGAGDFGGLLFAFNSDGTMFVVDTAAALAPKTEPAAGDSSDKDGKDASGDNKSSAAAAATAAQGQEGEVEEEEEEATLEVLMELPLKAPVTAASRMAGDALICGDIVGNVYAIDVT